MADDHREVVELQRDPRDILRLDEQVQCFRKGPLAHFEVICADGDQPERMARPGEHEPVVQPPKEGLRFLEERVRRDEVFGEVGRVAKPPECPGDAAVVAEFAKKRQRLVEQRLRLGQVRAVDEHREGVVVDGVGDRRGIAHLPGQRQTLVVETLGPLHVRLPVGEPTSRLERIQPLRWELTAGRQRQNLSESRPALVDVATHLPEAPERPAKAHRLLRVTGRDGPFERRSEVIVVLLEPIEPLFPLGAEEMRVRLLGERDEGLEVSVANQVGFTTFLEPFGGEVTDRLEHEKAWLVEVGHAPKQALVS